MEIELDENENTECRSEQVGSICCLMTKPIAKEVSRYSSKNKLRMQLSLSGISKRSTAAKNGLNKVSYS